MKHHRKVALVATIAVAVFGLSVFLFGGSSSGDVASAQATTTTTTSSTTTTTVPSGNTPVEVDPNSLKDVFEGPVDPATELAFGDEATEAMATAPQERGSAAHSAKTLMSPEDIVTWFNSGDPKAVPVRDRVALATIAQCGEADAKRIMAGEGWLAMVVLPASQVLGTSYYVGSEMEFSESWRSTQEADGYWLPVCLTGPNKGKVVANGMVRADCGNGHKTPKIRIIREDTPEAPPVETPPCVKPPHPGYGKWGYNPEDCTWFKVDQTDDEMQNGSKVHQPPQDNSTSGVDTGPTPGAPPVPYVPPRGPAPQPGTPSPVPNPGGNDSGTSSGTGTPGGSTTNPDGTTEGGGPTPPPSGPPIIVDDDDHSGDPGGF